jgi:hypothetical protein
MKELNTKIGVFLTTYTQLEIEDEINSYMDSNDSDSCKIFMTELKSFNPDSPYYITEEEAIEYTGLEMKASKLQPYELYTNYKGNPLGLSIGNVSLYYKDPIMSLKSAFEAAAPDFDFENDSFHVKIVK